MMGNNREERVTVTLGKYIASAVKKEQYPEKRLPEVAFIGRSNVGKSSLLNSLARVKNLARVSSRPGKTQTINFYEAGLKISGREGRSSLYLVDLPGYGYAKAGREQRRSWAKFIEEYFLESQGLRFVCQLMDLRHDPQASDMAMFRWLLDHEIPVLIVGTKADKVGKNIRQTRSDRIRTCLGIEELSILPYSSLKNEGRSDLLDVIADSLIQ